MKPAKILWFVEGYAPTQSDFKKANDLKAQVVFRNALAVPDSGALEDCDGVAGAVPERYKVLPTAKEAIAKKEKEADEEAQRFADELPKKQPSETIKPKTKNTKKKVIVDGVETEVDAEDDEKEETTKGPVEGFSDSKPEEIALNNQPLGAGWSKQ